MSRHRRIDAISSRTPRILQLAAASAVLVLHLAATAEARKFVPLVVPSPPGNRTLEHFYPSFPTGESLVLAGAPFVLEDLSSAVFASTSVTAQIVLETSVKRPVAVHLLLNASNGWQGRPDPRIGVVRLGFADGIVRELPLLLGTNVRDWQTSTAQVPRVDTTTDRGVVEVYRASRPGTESEAVLDLLTFVVDEADRDRVLTSVAVVDEVPGSLEPGLVLAGVSVQSNVGAIAYVRTNDLYLSDADGSDERRVTDGCTGCDRPSLSPDGQTIVYAKLAEDGTWEIRGLNVHTAGERVLGNAGPASPGPKPMLSADGRKVVFHKAIVRTLRSGATRVQTDVVSVDVTSGIETRITKTNGTNELFPAPAPDGSLVVYSVKGQLFQVQANGKKRKRITRKSPAMVDPHESVVDPTGRRVVFRARTCKSAECGWEVFSLERSSGMLQQLTAANGDASSPAALTDGKTVLFGAGGSIWAVGYDGGPGEQVVANAHNPGGSPTDLPTGCFASETEFTCYRPFRVARPTILRMGPSPSSAPVTGSEPTATVPASAEFGAASLPESMCLQPPATPVARPAIGDPPYVWGYVRAAGALNAVSGWIAEQDLVAAPDVTDLTGPEGRDYQCGKKWPKATSKCGLSDASAQLTLEPITLPECILAEDQLLYSSPGPDAWAESEVGTPVQWLSRNDLVEPDHFVAQVSPWRCVKVADSRSVPQQEDGPVYGWLRTDNPGWCIEPHCGDGRVGNAETCDDGNDVDGDGCRSDCTACGDGVQQSQWGETCEGGAGCRSDCTRCGDGVTQAHQGESCDGQPGCRNDCTRCGDGAVQAQWGETCDGQPGCRSDCTSCGDNVTQGQWGEQCDGASSSCEWGACQACACPAPKTCVVACANHSGGNYPVRDMAECQSINPCGFGAAIAGYQNGYPLFYPPEGGCGVRTRKYYDNGHETILYGPAPAYVCARCSQRNGHYRASPLDNPFAFLEDCRQRSISLGVQLCQNREAGGLISVFVGDCAPWP